MAKIIIQTDDGEWYDEVTGIEKIELETRERRQILIDAVIAKLVIALRKEI